MAIPVRLDSHSLLIDAPRELVYQKISSFGKGRLKGDDNESSRVLERSGNDFVAEFKTRSGLLTVTTIERVTLDPPNRISLEHIKGAFHCATEQFIFRDVDSTPSWSTRVSSSGRVSRWSDGWWDESS